MVDPMGGILGLKMRLKKIWDIIVLIYRLKGLTSCDILALDQEILKRNMINLLNKLIQNRKRTLRVTRNVRREISSSQIQKMGRFGQQLIVLSR